MPGRIRFFFSIMTLTFFVIAAVPLYRELSRRSDIWWTPRGALVPLGESGDRVEIYARGQPLASLLRGGQLRIVEGGGASALTEADVGLRFNNLDRVRAAQLPVLVTSSAACGVAALMFLLIVTGRLAYRPERGGSAP